MSRRLFIVLVTLLFGAALLAGCGDSLPPVAFMTPVAVVSPPPATPTKAISAKQETRTPASPTTAATNTAVVQEISAIASATNTIVASTVVSVTATASATSTFAPSATPEPSPTKQPTDPSEPTHTRKPTVTPEPTHTKKPTVTPEPTHTQQPTRTPTETHTPKPTRAPTETHTPKATATQAPVVTDTPEVVAAPTTAPVGSSTHRFVASKSARKYYYCDSDPAWHNLAADNLIWFDDEAAVQQAYPKLILHAVCAN